MNFKIRPYVSNDFNEIVSWWTKQNECPPTPGMMIEDGTFVLEIENIPALSLTVFLTQSKEISYIEGFVKNPVFKGVSLEAFGSKLWEHCFQYAKEKGYNRIICYCIENKLKDKYARFGMTTTCSSLTSFVKEL